MADRIVIMKDGVMQQTGAPMELYEHPCNKFVAGFIGSPQMNFYPVKLEGNVLVFEDNNKVVLPDAIARKLTAYKNEFIMGIRGEDIKFDNQNLDLYADTKQSAVIDKTEIMKIICILSLAVLHRWREYLNMRLVRLEIG